MSEVWRPIKLYDMYAFDGRYKYEVSNLGNVRKAGYFGHRRIYFEPRMMSTSVRKNGDVVVNLTFECIHHTCSVHRLVALAFLPNPDSLKYVKHIDGDKSNNCASNLMWFSGETKPADAGSPHLPCKRPVRQYTVEGRLVAEYDSCAAACRAVGIPSSGRMSACCKRDRNTLKGFVWRYTEDDEFAEIAKVHNMVDAYRCGVDDAGLEAIQKGSV